MAELGEKMFGKTFVDKQNKDGDNHKPILERQLKKSLEANIGIFTSAYKGDETLIVRRFQNKTLNDVNCCLLYFDGMVNNEIVNESIIKPVLYSDMNNGISKNNLMEDLQYKIITVNDVKSENKVSILCEAVSYGDSILLLEGYEQALIINTKGWQTRAITEPESEKIVRGPKEGFNESILINISLLRRKIKNTDFKVSFRNIGTRTQTKVCLCYIESLIIPEVMQELDKRLNSIDIDSVLDSGYIQELIRDEPFSPFETVGYSERPDVIAGKILEGRIAILVDGSPDVLTIPHIMAEETQANEDYYNNFIFASINRFLRVTSTVFAVSIPALFLAVVTYHQESLPTPLLLGIYASRQSVPFPTILSMIMMLVIFDALREAGTRMPTAIGEAINIVGTLVLGQAAVEAKLVSASVVIITALTGILTLMNPSMIGATIVLRFFLLLCASVLGIYGYIFGLILVLLHLMSMRSFGVPYMMNFTRFKDHNSQDIWIRSPWWSMTLRPKIIGARNLVRQSGRKNRRG